MKKITIFINLTLLSFSSLFAQNKTATPAERALVKGSNAINFYYGVNLFTGIYKNFIGSNALNTTYKQVGPIGIVYENMVTDAIGIGAELGYTAYTFNFQKTSTNSGITQTYNWEYKWSTIRAMFRANFHFAKSDKFDAYGLISAGYRQSHFSYTTNDPSITNLDKTFTFIPFGIKPGIGFRYFFADNIGLNLEIAAGTPIICGGLSFKF